jgi:hypothetical protein
MTGAKKYWAEALGKEHLIPLSAVHLATAKHPPQCHDNRVKSVRPI